MTIIAWDGQTLAADRQAQNGSTKYPVTKIFRWNDNLIGLTGNLSIGMEVLAWYKAGAVSDDFPTSNRKLDEGCSMVVIHPNKQVWKYESSPEAFRVEGDYCAFGCGDEAALVAMACGRTAQEAVRLVSMVNTGCGLGVDTLVLEC